MEEKATEEDEHQIKEKRKTVFERQNFLLFYVVNETYCKMEKKNLIRFCVHKIFLYPLRQKLIMH